MVNAGDILTYTVESQLGYSYSQPNDALSAIKSTLIGAGIAVESATASTPSAGSQLEGFLLDPLNPGQFSAVLQVQVSNAYNSPSDVQSIIDNAFYQAVGALPISSSIVDINGAGTGQATAAAGGSSNTTGATSVGDAVSSFFGSLGTGGTLLTGGIVIIVVLIVLLFAFPERGGRAVASLASA
jgi:hypothetical protein